MLYKVINGMKRVDWGMMIHYFSWSHLARGLFTEIIVQQEKRGTKGMERMLGELLLSCPRFYSLSLLELGFQARSIFGVIQAGCPCGLMFNVPEQFRKVTGYNSKVEHVNLHSEKTGNKQVKCYCSFHF